MARKIFDRAESLLMRDKFNDKACVQTLSRELEKFLADYVEFDADGYKLETELNKELTLTVKVKVKNFKHFNVIGDR